MAFNSEVSLVQDFTHNPEELIAAMQPLRAGGATALYDAVFLAVDEKLKGQTGRKVIVVITDGDDTASKGTGNGSRRRSTNSRLRHRTEEIRANFEVLKAAEETGGFLSSRPTLDGCKPVSN
jgi:Mg-chelatase subunit ChlD